MLTSKRCAMLLIAFTLLFVTSCSSCGSDPPPTSTPPPPDHQSSGFNFNEDAFVFANYGDSVVLIAGKPLGSVQGQDAMAILRLGDAGSGFRSHDEK